LGHFGRACCAVEAQGEDGVAGEGGGGGGDFGAEEHRAGGLDRDAHHDGNVVGGFVFFVERGEGGGDGALGLEEVLAGFDDEDVAAAGEEAAGLLAVGLEHLVPVDLVQGDQLGAGAHGAGGEAWLVFGRVLVAGGAGDLGGGFVEGEAAVLDV